MTEDLDAVWTALRTRGDKDARERLVNCYVHLVRLTAGRIAVHLPAHITEEDLYSAGAVGLLGAIDRFDPDRGVKFQTFAITRIRGAMLDELRQMDVLGRGTRERINKIRSAENAIRSEGDIPNLDSVAERANLKVDEVLMAERAMLTANTASLDQVRDSDGRTGADILADRSEHDPTLGLQREELRGMVDELLDEREKLLIALYYHEGLTLKEIGSILKVTEGRVSQMHTAILKKLKYQMTS